MIRGVNCMKCGKLLFEVVPLPPNGKYWAMHDETALELKSVSDDYYYECPHCSAKNIVIVEHHSDGPPQGRIISYKD
jgi:DNA-directed RNA polymerase subunit RPC12/RpoP